MIIIIINLINTHECNSNIVSYNNRTYITCK